MDTAKLREIYDASKECYESGKKINLYAGSFIESAASMVPYVGAVAGLLKCLMPGEPTLTLEDVLNTLQQEMKVIEGKLDHLLELVLAAGFVDDQLAIQRKIPDIMKQFRTALSTAREWESHPDDETVHQESINVLSDMDQTTQGEFLSDAWFNRFYFEACLYHFILWEGNEDTVVVMKPDECPDGDTGMIWDHTLMLPPFLEAIAETLLVWRIHWPDDYRTRFRDRPERRQTLSDFADRLWDVHNKIRVNIKPLPRPEHDACRLTLYDPDRPADSRHGWGMNSWSRLCGSVECYSGTAATGLFPAEDVPPAIPPGSASERIWQRYHNEEWPLYYAGFSFRFDAFAYEKQVALYRELGLPGIWKAINGLREIIEKPPLEFSEKASEEGFADLRCLSLRKIHSFIPEFMRVWLERQYRTAESLGLRGLARGLARELHAPSPISFRKMVTLPEVNEG